MSSTVLHHFNTPPTVVLVAVAAVDSAVVDTVVVDVGTVVVLLEAVAEVGAGVEEEVGELSAEVRTEQLRLYDLKVTQSIKL